MIEAVSTSEMPVNFYQTTWHIFIFVAVRTWYLNLITCHFAGLGVHAASFYLLSRMQRDHTDVTTHVGRHFKGPSLWENAFYLFISLFISLSAEDGQLTHKLGFSS
jgi:hypothetical protein